MAVRIVKQRNRKLFETVNEIYLRNFSVKFQLPTVNMYIEWRGKTKFLSKVSINTKLTYIRSELYRLKYS